MTNTIFYIVIGVLLAVIVILFIYIHAIKKMLNKMKKDIAKSKDVSYNRQITVDIFDNDVSNLAKEINELLDYQKKLGYETEQLQDKMKKSVSDIAHDLRTPITVINGNLQLMEKAGLDEKQKEYARICKVKTASLKSIVDDFFEMSLLESDQIPVELGKRDLTGFAAQFMIDHESVIRQHDLEPVINIPDKSVFIKADSQLLVRIFDNMLNNIFKYAIHSFSMDVLEDGTVVFKNKILDGSSIDIDRLFDRSYKGDKARTDSASKGLGLYIVKLLAEKQGAETKAYIEKGMLCISIKFNICDY